MNLPDTFAVFILTHGRPDNVITAKTLAKCGYTGKLFFIVDNEDKTVDRYIENFGRERVMVFRKKDAAKTCDAGNNFGEMRSILFARNACFDIAKAIDVTHFIELDDDYTGFELRWVSECGKRLLVKSAVDFTKAMLLYLRFFNESNMRCLAFAQGGDFIGGVNSGYAKKGMPMIRKVMNSFLCSTERPFKFIGVMNEDVNTYTTLGSRGELFCTVPHLSFTQLATQSQAGGVTDMYLRFGTYCKSFMTVMQMPSAVKVGLIPGRHRRIHHLINWKATVPCIVRETHRKADITDTLAGLAEDAADAREDR
jgi:hypothetical protein